MTEKTKKLDLQRMPSVDKLLNSAPLKPLIELWGRASVHAAIVATQTSLRAEGAAPQSSNLEGYYREAVEIWLAANRTIGHQFVFNVTGTILHTNLGRAVLDERMYDRVKQLVTRPASIELDLSTGKRGYRERAVSERLCRLINAEAGTVVNNNAAAVLIVLHTLARNRDVVVSRGELIEIGGSFRLPDIMEAAGSRLVEVGTTNRTHIMDYEKALVTEPALLLKIHPSNFRIEGFTKSVETTELADLARRWNIPSVVDLGSGALVDTSQFGLPREPMPATTLSQGADLVTFSGDKLLGGPQAGLIVGSTELISKINKNPLKRALRTSKFTLALLDETLKAYEDAEHLHQSVPTLRQLGLRQGELQARAKKVHAMLSEQHAEDPFVVSIVASDAEVGSGAMPGNKLDSIAVALKTTTNRSTQHLLQKLRELPTPVIARLHKDAIHMDMRGAEPLDEFLANLQALA
ncbi:MAG: L-seryl-tRNA(Sec) selenium transferase [Gammaproteobacteria bacterium]|nr:L-seryl-tRNA(Sec) selenium transferase [Gammaproteobacteria bacterium]